MNLTPPLVCALTLCIASGEVLAAEPSPTDFVAVDGESVVTYLRGCRKANGAFGPADQEYTDAAWNYPAVATLRLLGENIELPDAVLEHGVGYPRGHVGCGHWQFLHHHKIRQLLGQPIVPEHRRVQVEHQDFEVRYYGSPFGIGNEDFFQAGGRPATDPRDVAADKFGYYNLSSLYYLLAGLEASQRQPENPQPLVEYIHRRQSPGGGFVDVRTADGAPLDADAHVAHTFQAVASLKLLGADVPHAGRCAAFIQTCQLPSGAFRWSPQADLAGNVADVYYTWAALRTLDLLGQRCPRSDTCRKWIDSLQNDDGGFGDQPLWRSRLYSTYYAVNSLMMLTGNARQSITAKRVRRATIEPIPEGRFGIYQGLHKMPVCQPDDLAGLARRGLNLLALKSDRYDDAARLLPAIRQQNLPLDVVLCPEAYPHRLRHLGGVVLNHVGNFTLDVRWDTDQRARWQAADEAGRASLPWDEYRRRVLGPLRQLGGLCYPEQDFEMEYAYSAYDAGVSGSESYNAVLAGFNWSPRDFVRVFPWRERYIDKLTPIADCDAHGDLPKWSPQLDHTRHLFIASGPTYADFLAAAAAQRVVCVIANPEGVSSGVTYYGPRPAVDYVRRHVVEWRWWSQP